MSFIAEQKFMPIGYSCHLSDCTLGSGLPQQIKWQEAKITCSSDFTLLSSSWCFSVSSASCSLICLHARYSDGWIGGGWGERGVVESKDSIKVTVKRYSKKKNSKLTAWSYSFLLRLSPSLLGTGECVHLASMGVSNTYPHRRQSVTTYSTTTWLCFYQN